MVVITSKGDYKKTEQFLTSALQTDFVKVLKSYGDLGVQELAARTPADSGLTADSWTYDISVAKGSYTISWYNTNVNQGHNIAILIQYGHGTRNGGYVQGQDYINPAIQPIFEKLADALWREVSSK